MINTDTTAKIIVGIGIGILIGKYLSRSKKEEKVSTNAISNLKTIMDDLLTKFPKIDEKPKGDIKYQK